MWARKADKEFDEKEIAKEVERIEKVIKKEEILKEELEKRGIKIGNPNTFFLRIIAESITDSIKDITDSIKDIADSIKDTRKDITDSIKDTRKGITDSIKDMRDLLLLVLGILLTAILTAIIAFGIAILT